MILKDAAIRNTRYGEIQTMYRGAGRNLFAEDLMEAIIMDVLGASAIKDNVMRGQDVIELAGQVLEGSSICIIHWNKQ